MADNHKTSIVITALDQTAAGLASVNKRLDGIKSAAAAVGLSLSAMAGMAWLAVLVKNSIDAADSLSKLAQKTGTAVETLAGLKFAADQNGTSLEAVANASKKLSTAMVDKPELFKQLGINAKDSTGAMVQMADLFAAMPDGVNKTALAVKLMGKSGEEMIPFLNQGTVALREQTEQGKLFNPVTAESAAQAALFNDQLDALKAQASGLGVTIANDALPGLTQITSAMAQAAKEGGLLQAALVGVGGALSAIFTDDLLSREQQIAKELERLRGLMADNIKWGTAFGMVSMGGQTKQEVNNISSKMLGLQQELEAIQKADAAEKVRLGNLKEFRKLMAGMRIDAAQASVYELALGGASDAEIAKAQANVEKFKKIAADYAPTAKAVVSEYDKLIAKLKGGLVDATAAAQAAQHDYTKEQQAALEVMASPEWAKMSQKQRMTAAALLEASSAQGVQRVALEEAKKAAEATTKAEQEYMSGIGKTTEELIAKAAAAEAENAMIGMSAVQLAAATAQRYDEQIALQVIEADRMRGVAGREAEVFLIEQQIEALKRLKGAEVARPALQRQAEAWKNFTRDIESSLTDALMRGFENGSGFGENFVDTLRNTLKTAALKVVVQAMVNPVMSGINSMAQGGSLTGGTSGGALGYVNAGQTLWSGFSGGMASSMGGVVSGMGSLFGSAAMNELGAGMAGTFMGPTTAGSMAGIGSTIGAAMPYVAAAYVAYSLLKGNGGTPTSSTGNASMYFDAQGNRTDYQTYYGGSNAGTDAMVAGLQSSYMQAAMSLGIGTVATRFNFGGNTGKNGQSPNFALAGSAGSSSFSQSDTAVSDAAVQLAASRAVFAALQGSQLPDYLSSVFDGLTAVSMTQQDINNTLAYAQSLKALRDGLAETRTPLEIATAQMSDLSAEFHTSAVTFKTDFISAIDAGITPQTIARWQQLGTAIDQVTAASEQAAQAAQQAARAQLQAVLSASQSVYDTAKSSLLDAYARESDAAQQLADKMRGFASSFAALRSSLSLGALSTLSPEQKYQEAQRQFDDISRRAQLGDMDAMAQMDSVSQSFLQASRDYNASSAAYAADFARVSGALVASGSVAGRQADIATQQVTLLQAQLSALNLINTSVLSIADARTAYSAATNTLSASAAAAGNVAINNANPAGGSSLIDLYRINLGRAPDAAGLAYWSERFGDSIDAAEAQQFAMAALPEYLSTRSLPGFAAGGDHAGGLRIVGERGMELEATGPSRIFNADQTRNILSGGGNAETNGLLKEVVNELRDVLFELRADKTQRGAVGSALVNKLEAVADKLDGNKRAIRQQATGTNG